MAGFKFPKIALPKNKIISALVLLTIITLIIVAGYFFKSYYDLKRKIQDPTAVVNQEIEYIVNRVGKLIDLPKDERPTLATVSDKSKLSNQPFFAKAENGDKVLIYQKAKKAILYRPSINKLIEVGPFNAAPSNEANSGQGATQSGAFTPPAGGPSVSATPTIAPPLRITLYNGTTTSGLTKTVEKKLKAAIKNIEIVGRGNAFKTTYTINNMINLSHSAAPEIAQIQELLSAKVLTELPANESTPEAQTDLLIILGKDVVSQ